MNMAIIYGVITVLSLLLFLGYCWMVHQKDVWFMLLYISVFVVNFGYFSLAISKTLGEAMLANRISYLGSVFLPLFMLMIIMDVCKMKCSRFWLGLLICVSTATFLLAASGGYLDWYYKEVSITIVNGAAILNKVYGPLHNWYFVYLALYFGMMIGVTLVSFFKKKLVSYKHALLLVSLVFGNIAIWFIEQMIRWDFEFLSVSYIVTELYLLLLYDILQDYDAVHAVVMKQEYPVHVIQKLEIIDLIDSMQEGQIVEENEEEALEDNSVYEILGGGLKEHAIHEVVEDGLEKNAIYEAIEDGIEEHAASEFAEDGSRTNIIYETVDNKLDNSVISEMSEEKITEKITEDHTKEKKISEDVAMLLQSLTTRELDVLKYILQDKKRKDIAIELNVSENTIKKHTSHIFAKLEVSNRKELFGKLNISN